MKKGINDNLENFLNEFTVEARLYSRETAKDAYLALTRLITKHLRDDGYIKLQGLGTFKTSVHTQRIVGLKQGDMGNVEVTKIVFNASDALRDKIKLKTN